MVELEDFKYGGTNISALRMVDPNDESVREVVQDWVKGEMRFNRKIPFAGKTIRVSIIIAIFNLFDTEKTLYKKIALIDTYVDCRYQIHTNMSVLITKIYSLAHTSGWTHQLVFADVRRTHAGIFVFRVTS